MFALLNGAIRECADDIIQLSGALVRSKQVFRIAMEDLLPPSLFGELFHFLDDSDDDFFTPHFEDAVVYTVASFLGTLSTSGTTSITQESEGSEDE